MNTVRRLALASAVTLTLMGSSALAQQKAESLKKQVVGTWALVSAENTATDGTKSLPFGPNPKGMAMLDASGHFMVLNTNPATPKLASNNRSTGTPEENKAIVSQNIALSGTYTVNEAERALIWRVEASTFPNWVGQEQKRPIKSISANELVWFNPAASSAASASTVLTWKRVK
jgi:hypothetical protein